MLRDFWLRTNGVSTNGVAAKVTSFDRLGEKVRPGTFGEDKLRLTGVPQKCIRQKHEISSDPISADPICLFPSRGRGRERPGLCAGSLVYSVLFLCICICRKSYSYSNCFLFFVYLSYLSFKYILFTYFLSFGILYSFSCKLIRCIISYFLPGLVQDLAGDEERAPADAHRGDLGYSCKCVCICTCTCTCMYVCMYVCVCIYIYIYTYIHTSYLYIYI